MGDILLLHEGIGAPARAIGRRNLRAKQCKQTLFCIVSGVHGPGIQPRHFHQQGNKQKADSDQPKDPPGTKTKVIS